MVCKMLRDYLPPGCRREKPIQRPTLDAVTRVIDQILCGDRYRSPRHTDKRICERLREEHALVGGKIVTD